MFQKTIKKEVTFLGKGIHSGLNANVTLMPAKIDTGIIFFFNNNKIKFSHQQIFNTNRSITLGDDAYHIMTIEHLIASFYMLGITNIIIKIDNKEIPVLDGSALSFVKIIKKAGIQIQPKKVETLVLEKPITLFEGDKFIIGLPSDKLKITYHVDFNHPLLKNKTIHFDDLTEKIFIKKIAPARTFGFEEEVDDLLKKGLAHGGNLDNAVVLSKTGVLNKKLRFPDECIRHKVLDFIGALAFLQKPIFAHFIVSKSGHHFDIKFIQQLLATKTPRH